MSEKKEKKKKTKEPQNPNFMPPVMAVTESSPENNTTEPLAPSAEQQTQPSSAPLTLTPEQEAEAKAQLKQMADLLGVTQLAEQVTKLTEIVTAGQGMPRGTPAQGKPGTAGLEGLLSNPFVQGLLEKVTDALGGIMGGGKEASGLDGEILQDVKSAYIERQKAITNAANLLVDTVKGGGEIVRNSQTGVIEIRAPAPKPAA